MPHITEKIAIADPFLKRSTKLLPCQREMIVWWRVNRGLSQNQLAKMFHVSRRLITFVLDPEKRLLNYQTRVAAGGSMQYYDKDKQRKAIADTRRYKESILRGEAIRKRL